MKTRTLYKIITSALLLMVLACLISMVTLLINGPKTDILNGSNLPTSPEERSPAELTETHDYGDYYVDSMVFVGDKTISAMKTAGVLKDGDATKQIWSGKDGDLPLDFNVSSAHIVFPYTESEISIPDAAKEIKPQYMIITLGINNGIRCSEEKFKEYYGKLIEAVREVSPDTRIILQSIFPISKSYEKNNSGVTSEKIDKANLWTLELAESYGARYLNTASILKDQKGYLKQEYDSGNGIILNNDGYNAVLNYIRTHGYK